MSDLRDDIFDLVRVTSDPVTGLLSIRFPSQREVARLYSYLGIRAPIPENDDPLWSEMNDRLRQALPSLRAYANSGRGTVRPPSPRSTGESRTISTPTGDEAIVREMTGAQAREACDRLGLSVERHPTNAGISAMRCKNALYIAIRRGQSLLPPAPAKNKWVVS